MTQVIAVSKATKNVLTATNPNDFIFHSSYNTFKIIATGTVVFTLSANTSNQKKEITHNLPFIPLVTAFAKQAGISQVFPPNSKNVNFFGAKAGLFSNNVVFNYVSADAVKAYFNFDNNSGSPIDVTVKFYCLEAIN